MSDVNKNYLKGRILALEAERDYLELEVDKWKSAFDDAHAALVASSSRDSEAVKE